MNILAAPLLTVTPIALNFLQKKLRQDLNCRGLRLSVKKAGCSGFTYLFDYVTQVDVSDHVVTLEEGVNIFVDSKYLSIFQGLQIDYVKKGLNKQLLCINPNEVARCGCGESFIVSPTLKEVEKE
jgi:iron-sulfur cluster assembly protein